MKKLFSVTALLFAGVLIGGAERQHSDKERIAELELAVQTLHAIVADMGQWRGEADYGLQVLDARTQELHHDVQELQRRGPVAQR